MRFILLSVLAYGCSSVSAVPVSEELHEKRLAQIEQHILRLYYFQAHNECFTKYNHCRLSKNDKDCWTPHEQCVINVDKQYAGKI